jgi:uncharacterized membrane protein
MLCRRVAAKRQEDSVSASEVGTGGEPPPSAVGVAHLVYGLHSFAVVGAIVGSPTVIGAFVGSVPSLVAVVLSYVKRSDARGTWLASHYRWQIRTFWFAVLWVVVAVALFVTLVGIPLAIVVFGVITLWIVYRLGRGWLRLLDRRPVDA